MKANKYLCLLIVAMALLANTNMAWAMGGTGTTHDPYLIYNAADMREFADVVAGAKYL